MVLWQRYFYVCNINLDTSQSSDLKLSLIKNRTMPISFLKLLWKCQCKITQLHVQYCRPSVICVLVCLKHARQNLFVFFYASKELYQNNVHFPVIAFSNMPNLLKSFWCCLKNNFVYLIVITIVRLPTSLISEEEEGETLFTYFVPVCCKT